MPAVQSAFYRTGAVSLLFLLIKAWLLLIRQELAGGMTQVMPP